MSKLTPKELVALEHVNAGLKSIIDAAQVQIDALETSEQTSKVRDAISSYRWFVICRDSARTANDALLGVINEADA